MTEDQKSRRVASTAPAEPETNLQEIEEELERIIAEVSDRNETWEVDELETASESEEPFPEETESDEDLRDSLGNQLERLERTIEGQLEEQRRWMEEQVSGLKGAFDQVSGDGENREKLFNELHQMVSDYRDLFVLETIEKPILLDLLLLFDTIDRSLENLATAAEPALTADELMKSIRTELLEVLYRREVHPIEMTGREFDRRMQKIVGIDETDEENDGQQVTQVVRQGFLWRGKILRPQEIRVSRKRAAKPVDPGPTEEL